MIPLSNMGATWNASTEAVNTAIGMNVTDTQSDANSRLISLKVDNNDRLYVTKDGSLYSNGDIFANNLVSSNTVNTIAQSKAIAFWILG
jgi:hypothetical protein